MEDSKSPPQNSKDDTPKKSPFDDLSREDLVKKCKGLLVIAQKSKQARIDLNGENETLKERCKTLETQKIADKESLKTMQEFVDTLTEQKLNFATELDTLKKQSNSQSVALKAKQEEFDKIIVEKEKQMHALRSELKVMTDRLSQLDTEATSLQRQNGRLEKDNEGLVAQLDDLEKKIQNLNTLGLEQRNQLLELENSTKIGLKMDQGDAPNLIDVEKLSAEIETYKTQLLNLSEEKNCLMLEFTTLKEKSKSHAETMTNLESDLEAAKSTLDLKSSVLLEVKEKLTESEKHCELEKIKKDRLNAKLKVYREKIIKCSSSISQLKNSKFILLKTISEYSESVPKWQRDIVNASKLLSEQLLRLEAENKALKDQLASGDHPDSNRQSADSPELEMLKTEKNFINEQLKTANDHIEKLHEKKSEYKQELMAVKEEKEILISNMQSLESEKLILINEKKCARDNVHALEQDKLNLENINQEINESISLLSKEIKILKEALSVLEDERDSLLSDVATSKNDRSLTDQALVTSLKDEIFSIKSSLVSVDEQNKLLREANDMLKADLESLTVTLDQPNPEMFSLIEHNNVLQTDISKLKMKMTNYKTEYTVLLTEIKQSRLRLSELEAMLEDYDNVKAKFAMYKTENSELLNEMKEVNQVLKERGENITRQHAEIFELHRRIQSSEQEIKKMKDDKDKKTEEIQLLNNRLEEKESRLKLVASQKSEDEGQIQNWKMDKENLEGLLKERDGIIISLTEDIQKLKQNQQGNYSYDAPSENLSVSTVSRVEESSRLKDLDDSFEERYSKLRILALKLKKRVTELTNQVKTLEEEKSTNEAEKASLVSMLDASGLAVKNVQSIQTECDKMTGELEEKEAEFKNNDDICREMKKEIERLKSEVTLSSEKVSKAGKELDFAKKEKSALDMTIKELQNQLASSKKNVQSSKSSDTELTKLKADIAALEAELASEVTKHQGTRLALDKAKKDVKKKSVLSLEMEDYERSMNDLTAKMDENKKKIVQMESTIDTQDATINSLKTQIKMLEDQLKTEEKISKENKDLLSIATENLKEKEVVIASKNDEISQLEARLEEATAQNEEMSIQLASALGDKEKSAIFMGQEKLELSTKLKKMENRCSEMDDKLRIKSTELEDIKSEFVGYKVRAQSVLRQNQTKDLSLEENLKEEMAAVKAEAESLHAQLDSTKVQLEAVQSERQRLGVRCSDLQNSVTALQAEREASLQQHTQLLQREAAEQKNIKLQMTTLTQCYKKQISELEDRSREEISNLRKELDFSRASLARASITTKETRERKRSLQFMAITPEVEVARETAEVTDNGNILPEREEGEGSESTPSPSPTLLTRSENRRREPMPLQQLLEAGVPEDGPSEDDVEARLTQAVHKCQMHEKRLSHMTELLAEAEREVARRSQLGEALKEEVRRCQRSLERASHLHNQEYLKNVIVKFLTLGSGDERCRLVPVLHTILTLSPEETQQLNAVAKGIDPNANRSGWGGYLPWSGTR